MIKSLMVTNYLGESINLELGAPEKSGLLVVDISGLGPCKADVNTTSIPSDGAMFNSSRVSSRNIVLSMVLLENPDIETTRQLTYKYFPIKKKVKLTITTDNRTCETYGYVESNEPNIFSSAVSTQISIICPDPYFYSIEPTVTRFSGIEPSFSFPFSNESLSINLLEIGDIVRHDRKTVYYNGESETGIIMQIHAIGPASNISVYNSETREVIKIYTDKIATLTGSGLVNGDDIIISTVRGDRRVQLLRNGTYTNILNCIDKNSDWFQLAKGDNIFMFTAEAGEENLQFQLENKIIYEGV